MKKRFLLTAMFSIGILCFVSVNNVNAAASWYDQVTILSVGTATNGQGLVYLSGGTPTITMKYYTLGIDTTTTNQAIAVALTALSMGTKVGVAVDTAAGTLPIIQTLVVYPSE